MAGICRGRVSQLGTAPLYSSQAVRKVTDMPRVCQFTGKKTSFGNQVTHRGKPKYLGGVGTKVTGVTPRKFKPNIQRIKVSTKAIRNGLVVKPVRRKHVQAASGAAAA
jgi:large subunit ribosomal protein L28